MFKTNYSFRKAYGKPEDVVKRAKELGYQYAPIADIESTFGWSQWKKACEENDINTIYGVQLRVTDNIHAKRVLVDHFTFYAKSSLEGLNNVIQLAFKQGRSLPRVGFVPLLKYSDLETELFDDVIAVAGRKAQLHLLPKRDNVYFGLSPSCAKGHVNRAIELGLKPFFMLDQFFINKEDSKKYEVFCGMNADVKTYPQWMISQLEWSLLIHGMNLPRSDESKLLSASVQNRDFEFDQCTATIEKGSLLKPEHDKTLRQLCEEGAVIKGVDLNDPVYKERLDMELKVIQDKEFDDYFFIVYDLIDWCKDKMLVGAGRGSSAGSLVCYLLDITDVDPIKYGLLFFRFLDPSRPDWPDIDTDFSDRDMAIDYLVNKYGSERIARIGTLNNFKVKNTINEVCRSLLLNKFEFENINKEIEGLGLTANDSRWDTILIDYIDNHDVGKRAIKKHPEFEYAKYITSLPANASGHASGVIVANENIQRSFTINPISQVAMATADDMESIGYIKLDVLGLNNLTIIDKTMKMVGLTRDDLRKIDLEDKKVFDVMNEHKYSNIFQYEGAGVSKLARQVTVDSFNDFIAISSFARPGPLSSGSAERWVDKKNGLVPVSYHHELLKPYFQDTLGEMAYQEQIMLVAHDIAGLGWDVVSKMRKAIAKSMGAEALREFGDPFKQGLIKAGVDEETTNKFWQDVLGCGAYLFNKSHAAAYGLISYWTCYLKAYYPLEFACAALTATETVEKQIAILRELKKEGVDYVPFDIDHSTESWRVIEQNGVKKLLAPLTSVKGIGNKTMSQILSCRARNEPLPESIQKRLQKAKSTFSSLTPVTDYMLEVNARKYVVSDFTPIEDIQLTGDWCEDVYICGVCTVIAERDENEPKRVQDRLERGQQGMYSGQTKFVELRVTDDTGTYFAKIGRNEFNKWGVEILEKGKEKKTVVIIKGTLPPSAPVLLVKNFKILGDME